MRSFLFYDAVKVDGPKKKILEFNAADSFMDEKELKHFEALCLALQDKNNYFKTSVGKDQLALLDKLIGLPSAKVFACLDLYRIFLGH